MAETITIPSPSVFLRASPEVLPRLPEPDLERKRATTKKKKRITPAISKPQEGSAVTKPKQSKSRNGMPKRGVAAICLLHWSSKHAEFTLQGAPPAKRNA